MKAKETIDAIGFVTLVGVLTAGAAVAGVVQAAAAGVDLLLLAPFAFTRKTVRVRKPIATIVRMPREDPVEVHMPQAA